MDIRIDASWKDVLKDEFSKEYFIRLTEFIREEYRGSTPIYPPARLIFNAFDHCPFNDVKVVILGQDPYHGAGQANGLCFSVNKGVACTIIYILGSFSLKSSSLQHSRASGITVWFV